MWKKALFTPLSPNKKPHIKPLVRNASAAFYFKKYPPTRLVAAPAVFYNALIKNTGETL
jgi:hypothetical protein